MICALSVYVLYCNKKDFKIKIKQAKQNKTNKHMCTGPTSWNFVLIVLVDPVTRSFHRFIGQSFFFLQAMIFQIFSLFFSQIVFIFLLLLQAFIISPCLIYLLQIYYSYL